MKKKLDQLIKILRKQPTPISAKELATMMGVSDRTIRNYVAEVNQESSIIESNFLGYQLIDGSLKNQNESLVFSEEPRVIKVLRMIIDADDKGLDIFDLTESFFVSESVIKTEINKINELIANDGAKIISRKNKYYISFEDKEANTVIFNLIRDYLPSQRLLNREIQNLIGEIDIRDLVIIVKRAFSKFNKTMNTYEFRNFLLHFAIAINRSEKSDTIDTNEVADIVGYLSNEIFDNYQIRLNDSDLDELRILLGYKTQDMGLNEADLKVLKTTLRNILDKTSIVFGVGLRNEEFESKFFVHLTALIKRSRLGIKQKNPSTISIKTKYPFIFDIAVYITKMLRSELDIVINDDEISLIALHIGSFMSSNEPISNYGINIIIVTQDLTNNYYELEDKIKSSFSKDLITVKTIDAFDFEKMDDLSDIDLIITTSEMDTYSKKVIQVNEIFTQKDQFTISHRINDLINEKNKEFIGDAINDYLDENLFEVNATIKTSVGSINRINELFLNEGYVFEDFKEQVLSREVLSPTSYPTGVAIPHSIDQKSRKTGICILIPKQPIKWDKYQVNLVVGISVSPKDQNRFNKFFPDLVQLLTDESNVDKLKKEHEFNKFKIKLNQMLEKNN